MTVPLISIGQVRILSEGVVDPVPAKLKPKSRGLAAKGLLTILAVFALSLLWIVFQMRLEALANSNAPAHRRLAALFSRSRGERELRAR